MARSSLTAVPLGEAVAELGEGPVWDPRSGRLLWVDIEGHAVLSTDPRTGETSSTSVPLAIGVAALRESGGLIAALEDGFWSIDDDGRAERLVEVPENAERGLRFNDGACDPQGRFWAGTMAWDPRPGAGSLYRVDPDLTVIHVLSGVTISNGLAWSPDGGSMYYVDTPTRRIDIFDFDGATGEISRRRPFVAIEDGPGHPDGICVDVEGAVWVALWPGWSVRRYLSDGRLDRVVDVPAARVSSCAFGGEALDDLFITTAWTGLTPTERAQQPLAGRLFRTRPGVAGLPRGSFAG